jgi:uncharacterized protein YbjT (DUF2867 family)
MMILVLGATGTTGGEVARQLIQAGHRPRLLVRDPSKAQAFAGNAEIVHGDLSNPASLAAALDGVHKLYLATGTHGGIDLALETRVIDAAQRAGVAHVVKLSVVRAEAPLDLFGRWHAQAEAHLRASGMAWTMLRPHYFMTNTLRWADTIRAQGAVYYPTADGCWAAVDPVDIGAVAVQCLIGSGHEGQAYTLSGPESLSAAQYAAQLAAAIGKPAKFIDSPPEAARAGMVAGGMPSDHVDALMDLLSAMKAGKLAAPADDVSRVTGRPATRFADWARRNAAAFR